MNKNYHRRPNLIGPYWTWEWEQRRKNEENQNPILNNTIAANTNALNAKRSTKYTYIHTLRQWEMETRKSTQTDMMKSNDTSDGWVKDTKESAFWVFFGGVGIEQQAFFYAYKCCVRWTFKGRFYLRKFAASNCLRKTNAGIYGARYAFVK